MGRWKVGSLTAALGCIALGVIVALAQFGQISYAALGYLWPVLLIMFGLEMLLRLFIRSDTKSRMSGWAIVLIIVLVGASAGQSAGSGGLLGSIFGKMKLAAVKGTVEVESGVKAVKILLPEGKVRVNGVEGGTLDYEGSLLVPGKSSEEAERTMEEKWKVTVKNDVLVMELDTQTNWRSYIHIGFNTKTPYLDVNVPQALAVEIETSDGSIEAKSLLSGLSVRSSNGAMDVQNIAGGVEAHTSNGSLTVANIKGGADLVSSNGAIRLENIEGSLKAKSSNGKITADSGITGEWDCKSSNGKITLDLRTPADAKITADTSNGSLKGNVNWERDGDNHGTAVIGKGTYGVKLSTSNGSVTVDSVE